MSTSDSDYSIDWLASDEDDYDSPKRLSPEHGEEPLVPPSSSSSSSSSRDSPTSCFHCEATQRRWRRRCDCCDCKDGGGCGVGALQSPALSPLQGFTSVYTQQALHLSRKRAHSAASDALSENPGADTENQLFSQKCSELQRYIQPLSSILRGLRSGRYSQRLSSFQESVAMDRIQRIMGVLQNPDTGGRFLNIILKIEEMLQSWFPHIKPNLTHDGVQPKRQKHHHHHGGASLLPPPPPSSLASLCSSDVDPASLGSLYSTTHLKWLHTSPICSLKTPESMLVQRASSSTSSTSPLPSRCSQEVTQDNAVSSSTDSHKTTPPLRRLGRGRLAFKISSPCLERLLQAKESIIAPRTDGGWMS